MQLATRFRLPIIFICSWASEDRSLQLNREITPNALRLYISVAQHETIYNWRANYCPRWRIWQSTSLCFHYVRTNQVLKRKNVELDWTFNATLWLVIASKEVASLQNYPQSVRYYTNKFYTISIGGVWGVFVELSVQEVHRSLLWYWRNYIVRVD